jgi:hypothetical protein
MLAGRGQELAVHGFSRFNLFSKFVCVQHDFSFRRIAVFFDLFASKPCAKKFLNDSAGSFLKIVRKIDSDP